ncbi:MAG: hypothetical protein B9J98_00915 [Candidatus Terraquivivens tikiterensis]|uniref:Uncharacterized protein n=1 Tax=Candidatus Terraquivivens tikiterensis TaxID=1980982 RepID=A0A2R7Y9L7_9ARCH|nr:MAG: hypothetical protein B9J98_00915 [Candidatus Terraquivivens tikiterensis]
MRLKGLNLAAVALTLILLASMVAQAAAIAPPSAEGTTAEAMVNVATKAEARVKALLNGIQANSTIMAAVENAGLKEAFDANASLLAEGSALLASANESLVAGNYSGATTKAVQAMRLFKDAFINIHRILEQAGVEGKGEKPEVKAQGLLIAIKRALERIERIEALPDAKEVEGILEQARALLNTMDAEQLLAQGNVTGVAHRLAEANKLIMQAFKELKSKAEGDIRARAEKFIERLKKILIGVEERARSAGLNVTEVMESLGNFSQLMDELIERIRSMKPGDIKGMMDELKDVGKKVEEAAHSFKEVRPTKAKVGDILSNPDGWKNKTVVVIGNYYGSSPPEGLKGPNGKTPSGSWWIIADETGWIYVVDGWIRAPTKLPKIKLPELLKAKAVVIGKVEVENGTPYVYAIIINIVPQALPPAIPKAVSGALSLTVEKEQTLRGYTLKVSVANVGNEIVVFQNAACGIHVERKVGDLWTHYHTPVSAQVILELKPGETRAVTINLPHPPKGAYRVVAIGWLKDSHALVEGVAEFDIP